MSDRVYDFDEQLAFGQQWESELSERLESVLTRTRVQNISYDDDPDMERRGIDAIIEKERPELQVKVQRYEHSKTGNLPIEVISVAEASKPGWFYTTDAELIAWAYANQAGNNFLPTGYYMLHNQWLIDWFNDRYDQYRRIEVSNDMRGREYTTVCRLVPIDDFPPNHLWEFNPMLVENKKTDQYELVQFMENTDT